MMLLPAGVLHKAHPPSGPSTSVSIQEVTPPALQKGAQIRLPDSLEGTRVVTAMQGRED